MSKKKVANVDSSKKSESSEYWKTISAKYDSVNNFKKQPKGVQLAKLYKYFEERLLKYSNQRAALADKDPKDKEVIAEIKMIELEEFKNRKYFLRAVLKYGLSELWLSDCRLV